MIQWKVKAVMRLHDISARALSEELQLSSTAISILRRVDMPRMDGEKLNQLMLALNRMRRADSPLITLTDIMEFSLSMDELSSLNR